MFTFIEMLSITAFIDVKVGGMDELSRARATSAKVFGSPVLSTLSSLLYSKSSADMQSAFIIEPGDNITPFIVDSTAYGTQSRAVSHEQPPFNLMAYTQHSYRDFIRLVKAIKKAGAEMSWKIQ